MFANCLIDYDRKLFFFPRYGFVGSVEKQQAVDNTQCKKHVRELSVLVKWGVCLFSKRICYIGLKNRNFVVLLTEEKWTVFAVFKAVHPSKGLGRNNTRIKRPKRLANILNKKLLQTIGKCFE